MTSSKKENKGMNEWLILFGLSGFISMKALSLHDIQSSPYFNNPNMLYLSVGALLLWLISAAKSKMFNVFILVRKTPKAIWNTFLFFKNDYLDWKNKRGYYAKK